MNDRLRILEMVEQGRISADDGVRLLRALEGDRCAPAGGSEVPEGSERAAAAPGAGSRPVPESVVTVAGQSVLGVGVAILVGGGLLLARFYGGEAAGGLGWGWFLFILGVLLTVLAWWLRRARWLAVRVRESDGSGFQVAVPVSMGLAAWGLQLGGRLVPGLEQDEADALVDVLRGEFGDERVLSVRVDDDESGDQVDVTIG